MAQSGHIIAHIAQPMHASSSVQYAVNTPSLLRFSCWIATICLGHAVVHSSQPLQRSKMTFIFAIGVTIPFRILITGRTGFIDLKASGAYSFLHRTDGRYSVQCKRTLSVTLYYSTFFCKFQVLFGCIVKLLTLYPEAIQEHLAVLPDFRRPSCYFCNDML